MKSFKFFSTVLVKSHDGHDINVDEWFYTVNKERMTSPSGKVIPKYTIVTRIVDKRLKFKFKPDHEALWYFKSKENAYWCIDIWRRQDKEAKYEEWFEKIRRRRTR